MGELSPEGVNLKALLAAYDEARKGMTEEEKKAMNQRIVSGEQSFSITPEEAERRRAAVRIAELEGKTVEGGQEDVEALEEAAKKLKAPGISNLLKVLGRDETKER